MLHNSKDGPFISMQRSPGELRGEIWDTGSACTLVKRGMRRLSDGGGWVRGLCEAWKNTKKSETTHIHTKTNDILCAADPPFYTETYCQHAELKHGATPLNPDIQSSVEHLLSVAAKQYNAHACNRANSESHHVLISFSQILVNWNTIQHQQAC